MRRHLYFALFQKIIIFFSFFLSIFISPQGTCVTSSFDDELEDFCSMCVWYSVVYIVFLKPDPHQFLFVIISLIGYSFSPLTLTYSTTNQIFLFLIIKNNVSYNGSCAIVVCTCRTSVRRGSKYGVRNVLVCFIYTQFLFLLLFLLKPIMHSCERPITPPLYPLSSVSQQNTFFFRKMT
jgi:hypothetical protein